MTLTTPGDPMATYKRAKAGSCMTTSGSPGSATLPSTAPVSRCRTTSDLSSAAQKTRSRDGQAVRSRDRNLERPRDFKVGCAEHNDFCWLLNVSVDVISDRIVHSPTRTTGKRNRRDHPHLVDGHNGDGAIFARRITDIENEQTTPGTVK